ncbi:acyl-CoA dehydrogenase family protein [Janibacter melonis]|uniref:acyl-CoA dehydrogenase family protein n=1 Tax=Janibacter melonis TaxID=262209 RepID=UPI0020945EEA|nr:acyl-CoA dehydrogenase family protein [Janibacter melonis]
MGGHTVVAKLIQDYGTQEQKDRYLPRMATGEVRATMALTEPGAGPTSRRCAPSPAVARTATTWSTGARRGSPTRHSSLVALLCKTDPGASPAHTGISILLVDKERLDGHGASEPDTGGGLTVSRDLPKLGYKGVESCELVIEGCGSRPTRSSAASRVRVSRR